MFCFQQIVNFSKENNLTPKALLLIDNCSAHSPIEELQSGEGNIVAYLLPPNVTAAVQPMDQNPIKVTKLNYRKKLLTQLIGEGGELNDLLKRHSIRNAIILLKQAWDDLPQKVLKNSWSNLMNWDSKDYDSDDDLPLAQLLSVNANYNEILQINHNLLAEIAPNHCICIEEIEKWNEDVQFEHISESELSDNNEASDDSGDDVVDVTTAISQSTAIESVNNLLKWCKNSELYSTKHTSNLLTLRNDIVLASLNKPKKQTNITDYVFAKDV